MQEIIIRNWDELQSAIFDGVWDPDIMRYRNNCVYRGMSDKNWSMLPSLNRVCAHDLTLERQMLRSFRKYGYADLQQVTSFWQMLAMAQQFGLPTRLLDWTYSPLVAAHFATEDLDQGPIICQDIQRVPETASIDELVELGKDIEKRTLSAALKLWLEHRVFVFAGRTFIL